MQQSIIDAGAEFNDYASNGSHHPLFLTGSSLDILKQLPANTIDCCVTSPPYWNQREYADGGIGLEPDYQLYIQHLLAILAEVQRVLKSTGSLWLNIGDAYINKGLVGLPWRVALALSDEQGWILRNDVVWNKLKGPDNTLDKLRNIHEYIFHFVKQAHGYYYDADAIRNKPRPTQIRNGAIISATGVSGVRYRRQLELSTALAEHEKAAAFKALDEELGKLTRGELSDFRMVIRNQQRTTHSDSEKLSGRAKELAQHGFYFLRYHPKGSKPGDVWEIVPEDTTDRETHYAAYPEDLCKIPILATCPPAGIVLDPFCGTGTTNLVAMNFFRKSVGIDISPEYIRYAEQRCHTLL